MSLVKLGTCRLVSTLFLGTIKVRKAMIEDIPRTHTVKPLQFSGANKIEPMPCLKLSECFFVECIFTVVLCVVANFFFQFNKNLPLQMLQCDPGVLPVLLEHFTGRRPPLRVEPREAPNPARNFTGRGERPERQLRVVGGLWRALHPRRRDQLRRRGSGQGCKTSTPQR